MVGGASGGPLAAAEARIDVDASRVVQTLPRTQFGVCIEDVNHEIYGGLYSQMVFGESFQEPAGAALPGFRLLGGQWKVVNGGELAGQGGGYPKAVSEHAPWRGDAEAAVQVFFDGADDAVAGLLFRVGEARWGVDDFTGYEVALNPGAGFVRLARHRRNYEPIRDVKCPVPTGRWVDLSVRMVETTLEVRVDGQVVIRHDDGAAALRAGTVGVRHAHPQARFRQLRANRVGEPAEPLPFWSAAGWTANLSGCWQGVATGTATGETRLETERPFVGRQSQRLTFVRGEGGVGVANAGLFGGPVAEESTTPEADLDHGMCLVAGQPYEGCVWARTEAACDLVASLENGDGKNVHAEVRLHLPAGNEWQRLPFTLTPKAAEARGRLVLKLTAPGSVVLGYAGLHPGEWGRYQGLPVRRDVVQGLLDQGVTTLRYGGSMVNVAGYRWKHMVGPRERRAPYRGNWYPYSTNGWAVPDFLNLCEAAGFLGIPDLSVDETPQDLADFIEYVNGPANSPWGRQRAADGHPAPYGLRHLELGNEEKVDEAYFRKFQALAERVWAADPQMVLVVGDFAYTRPIDDPFHIRGADSGITTLAAQQKILALAREHGREVWFDVHVNTETPDPASDSVRAFPSYVAAVDQLAEGAKHRVVCFELNANTHDQNRALANAQAIQLMQRMAERVPVVCSANGLQPDSHNDNGWNQGLLFLNPARVWLQPPGYVTRLLARHAQALLVQSSVTAEGNALDVCATRSEDGRTLAIQVLNLSHEPMPVRLNVTGLEPGPVKGSVEFLAGEARGVNTAGEPGRVVPRTETLAVGAVVDGVRCTFAPRSFSVLRLER